MKSCGGFIFNRQPIPLLFSYISISLSRVGFLYNLDLLDYFRKRIIDSMASGKYGTHLQDSVSDAPTISEITTERYTPIMKCRTNP